jgi:hypothetical protein
VVAMIVARVQVIGAPSAMKFSMMRVGGWRVHVGGASGKVGDALFLVCALFPLVGDWMTRVVEVAILLKSSGESLGGGRCAIVGSAVRLWGAVLPCWVRFGVPAQSFVRCRVRSIREAMPATTLTRSADWSLFRPM